MAANRPHVPKFGNWEAANNTPYTVVFDNARKGRTDGRMINPNDPQENPNMFPNHRPPPQAPPSRNRPEPEERVGPGRGAARPAHEHRYIKEDDNLGRRAPGESPQQQQGGRGSNSGRTARPGGGSVHSIDRSPMHPQHQPKLGGRGNGSPFLEGKNSYDGTPGRSKGRPAGRGDETPSRGTVLPKFGDWDVTDPASADNFTQVFNKAREDKNATEMSVGVGTGASYANVRRQQPDDDSVKVCCCWWRK